MAVSVEFTTFIKRRNSTKKPNHTTDVFMTMDCVYKEPTDVIRPTLRLKIARSMGDPHFLNYCYIPNFLRYYWVRNWRVLTNDQWECDLEEDFLASWKSVIGSETKYILRSASNYDGSLIDNYYPAKVQHYQNEQSLGNIFRSTYATYVIGIIGAGTTSSQMGAVQYYAMNTTQLVNLFNSIFSNASWLNISTTEMSEELQKAFINPYQYISSAMCFPFDTTPLGTYVDNIKFGWWTLSCSGYRLGFAPVTTKSYGLHNIPKHPQAASRGEYLNVEPYSTYMMYSPGAGYYKIDAGALLGADQIAHSVDIDLISGQSKHWVLPYNSTSEEYLRELTPEYGQIGVPIELAQVGRGALQGGIKALSEIASTALAGYGGPISNALSGIVSAAGAAAQTVQSKGHNGGLMDFTYPNYSAYIYNWNYLITDSALSEIGAPCCKNLRIDTLTGYVLCEDGHVANAELLEEKEAIERYMTTGFFFE